MLNIIFLIVENDKDTIQQLTERNKKVKKSKQQTQSKKC